MNKASSFKTIRVTRIRLRHRPETARALYGLREAQRHAYNEAVVALRPCLEEDAPLPALMRSPSSLDGLFGQLTEWRRTKPGFGAPLAVQRPGVRQAREALERALGARREAVGRWLRASPGRRDPARIKGAGRPLEARRLLSRRKRRGGVRSLTIDDRQALRRIDDRHLGLPGGIVLRALEDLPPVRQIRSAQVVEVTKDPKSGMDPGSRRWRLHIAVEIEVPPPPKDLERMPIGVDPGIVNEATMSCPIRTPDNPGEVRHHHRMPSVKVIEDQANRARRDMARRRPGSRAWKAARQDLRRRKREAANIRDRFHRDVAAGIVRSGATCIGIEDTPVKRMAASAKGSRLRPGNRVRQKRGLDRELLGRAPGALNQRIKNAGGREGVPVHPVPAAGTSITCPACGHRAKENRESQAEFRCRACGHKAHADVVGACNVGRLALCAALAHAGGSPAGGRDAAVRGKGRAPFRPPQESMDVPAAPAAGGETGRMAARASNMLQGDPKTGSPCQ